MKGNMKRRTKRVKYEAVQYVLPGYDGLRSAIAQSKRPFNPDQWVKELRNRLPIIEGDPDFIGPVRN